MAIISLSLCFSLSNNFRLPPPPYLSTPTPIPRRSRVSCSSSPSMNSGDDLTGPHRSLMVELLSFVESRLGSSLQPCSLPSDVQHFGNPDGTAHASLQLRPGVPSSQIDFILEGLIHCKLPSGGSLNISSLSAYLKPSTDAPHFLIDLIQSSPNSLVLILDLTPRKDLISHLDYLKTYYEDTGLDRHRQRLQSLPEVRPYFSPSLYVRALVSPTAILVSIDTGDNEKSNIEEIIQDHVSPIAKELLQFWMDYCACEEKHVEVSERAYLAERDRIIKNTTIEVDLGSSFPRLFGKEVAERVLGVLKENYDK